MEDAFVKTPDLQYVNGLFAQIDFEHQQLKPIDGPETSTCGHVTEILNTPMPGVEFGMKKTMNNYKMHKDNSPTTKELVLLGHHFVMQILTV